MTFNANYCWNSINFHLTLKNLLSCLVQRKTKKFITQKQNFKETEIYFVLNGFFSEGRFDSIFPVWFFISECTKWCDCVCVWVCTDSLGITHVVINHFVKNHFVKNHFVKNHFLKTIKGEQKLSCGSLLWKHLWHFGYVTVVSPINPKSWVGGLKVFRDERTD